MLQCVSADCRGSGESEKLMSALAGLARQPVTSYVRRDLLVACDHLVTPLYDDAFALQNADGAVEAVVAMRAFGLEAVERLSSDESGEDAFPLQCRFVMMRLRYV